VAGMVITVATCASACAAGTGTGTGRGTTGLGGSRIQRIFPTARESISAMGRSGGISWVVSFGRLWLTANGGLTWRHTALPHLQDRSLVGNVLQLTFLNRRNGWIVARWGAPPSDWEVIRTADGGQTWRSSTPPGTYGSVAFVTARRGYLLGGALGLPTTLFSTADAGATWTYVTKPPFGGATPFAFVDAGDGVAQVRVNNGGWEIFHTRDGGSRWSRAPLPRSPRARNEIPFPLIAAFGPALVIPAHRGGRLLVYISNDRGETWSVSSAPRWVPPPSFDAFGQYGAGPFSAASAKVWVVYAERRLYVTADAGRRWRSVQPLDLPASWQAKAIQFTTMRDGWAIFSPPGSAEDVLVRTTDGGVHWEPVRVRFG
jgi:photosystem II stability/assembly factor-like uncharacterized protein